MLAAHTADATGAEFTILSDHNHEAADRFRAAIDADPLYPLPRANLQHVESLLPP